MLDSAGTEWQDEKLRLGHTSHRARPVAKSLSAVSVPKWRNWQTRYIQGVVPVREWRFESSLRHQSSRNPVPGRVAKRNPQCGVRVRVDPLQAVSNVCGRNVNLGLAALAAYPLAARLAPAHRQSNPSPPTGKTKRRQGLVFWPCQTPSATLFKDAEPPSELPRSVHPFRPPRG